MHHHLVISHRHLLTVDYRQPPSTSAFSSGTTIFPLPLFVCPTTTASTSRRCIQSRDDRRRIVRQANHLIQSLNTLYFNYPSEFFLENQKPCSYSLAQGRLLQNVYKQSSHYYSLCRGPRQVHCGQFLNFIQSATIHQSLCLTLSSHHTVHTECPQSIDSLQYSSMPHLATPMIYGPSPAIVPIQSARISLPETLNNLSIISLLPYPERLRYESESAGLILSESDRQIRLQQLRMTGRRLPSQTPRAMELPGEYARLIKRLLAIGMISFTKNPVCVNGIFGVKKDDISDRLIIDARRANTYFIVPPKVKLPSPSDIIQLRILNQEIVVAGKMDLSNYYHQLGLPHWLHRYFALPPLSAAELGLNSIEYAPSDLVYPCCATLPMGWSHSVYVAQLIHERVLYEPLDGFVRIPPLSRSDSINHLHDPRINRVVHAVYIDDLVVIGPLSRQAEIQSIYDHIIETYKRFRLPVKESKCVRPTDTPIDIIGIRFNGRDGAVGLSLERHHKVMTATVHLLSLPSVSGHSLSVVIGHWTWHLLLRRPVLSVLQRSYSFIAKYANVSHPLWPKVRRELLLLMSLSPTLQSSLRAQLSDYTVATDASTLGAGVVVTETRDNLIHSLWPLTMSLHQLSSHDSEELLENSSISEDESLPVIDSIINLAYSAVSDSRWSTIISSQWHHEGEHINALELRAVLLAARWILSHSSTVTSRTLVIVDSSVVYYILRKGRSSSSALLSVYRRLAAFLLAADIYFVPCWVPSAHNPADDASRLRDIDYE
jgi:Reverse transcriptase (RNA-dependent DNA polymerase)